MLNTYHKEYSWCEMSGLIMIKCFITVGVIPLMRSLLIEQCVQEKQADNGDKDTPHCKVMEFTHSLGVVQDTDELLQDPFPSVACTQNSSPRKQVKTS